MTGIKYSKTFRKNIIWENNKMKKSAFIIAAALLILAAPAFAKAKASKKSKASKQSAKTSSVKFFKDPKTQKPYDFGGLTVCIYDWWSNPKAAPASKFEEEQRAFRKSLEDSYNFKVIQIDLGAGWNDHPAEVANYCITGGDDARIFVIDSRSALSGAANGLWADVSKVPDINWRDKKWNKAVCSVLPGQTFAVGKPEPRQVVFFNKRVLQENGYNPDWPYDLQKSGKWTWEAFEAMCDKLTKDTDNDGIIDQYALSGFNSEFTVMAIYSNGGALTQRDKNGNINLDFSDRTMESLNWVKDVFLKYNKPADEGANWDYFKSDFLNGKTAFYVDQEYNAQANGILATMKDDWGMVCFPLGPHGDKKYFSMNQDNMFVIPACYSEEKINKIMKIYDIWTTTVPGYEDADAWKEGYYGCFRDTRAVDESMQYMIDNSKSWDAWLIPNFNWSPISWNVCGGMDPVEVVESMRNELQAALDDINQ